MTPWDTDNTTLSECGVADGTLFRVHIVEGLQSDRNGNTNAFKVYPVKEIQHMTLGADSSIPQVIRTGDGNAKSWDQQKTIVFNLQLLDVDCLFKQLLGIDPPDTPVTAATYAQHGYPFDSYVQSSGVSGDFELRSMGAFDKEICINNSTHEEDETSASETKNPGGNGRSVVRLNTIDKKSKFVPLEELAFPLATSAAPPSSRQ